MPDRPLYLTIVGLVTAMLIREVVPAVRPAVQGAAAGPEEQPVVPEAVRAVPAAARTAAWIAPAQEILAPTAPYDRRDPMPAAHRTAAAAGWTPTARHLCAA